MSMNIEGKNCSHAIGFGMTPLHTGDKPYKSENTMYSFDTFKSPCLKKMNI